MDSSEIGSLDERMSCNSSAFARGGSASGWVAATMSEELSCWCCRLGFVRITLNVLVRT